VLTILFQLLIYVLQLYMWAVILAAVFSMLASFGILDTRNRMVWTIGDFLYRLTEPVLRPIRNILPDLGGIDISPLVVILVIQFLAIPMLVRLHNAILFGSWQGLLL
jgi:YggT family protein